MTAEQIANRIAISHYRPISNGSSDFDPNEDRRAVAVEVIMLLLPPYLDALNTLHRMSTHPSKYDSDGPFGWVSESARLVNIMAPAVGGNHDATRLFTEDRIIEALDDMRGWISPDDYEDGDLWAVRAAHNGITLHSAR